MLNSHRFKTLLILSVLLGLLALANFWSVSASLECGGLAPLSSRSRNQDQSGARPPHSKEASDVLWRDKNVSKSTPQAQRAARPNKYRSLTLDTIHLQTLLQKAPREFTPAVARSDVIISLPMPDGSFMRFAIQDSPIMEEALAARFPQIRTFRGQSIGAEAAITRFDWTPQGFHGIVLTQRGTVLIEPDGPNQTSEYIAYFQGEMPAGTMECAVDGVSQDADVAALKRTSDISALVSSGSSLRTYRLAVAATAEYTQAYGGGTVSGGLAAVTTTVNLVNAIYERDVAVRLVLIGNEDSIIFTDTATDGYTSDNVNALINENQTKLDAVIGSANYDIGHVFDGRLLGPGVFSFQGIASLGVVCRPGVKARGVSIARSVQPHFVIAYYSAAHEMGHQFSATHTFNATSGTCGAQRASLTAYEPGTGSTIMGYRFACAAEDLMSQDTYFHNASIEQIVNYTTIGSGNLCPTATATGNNIPSVDAGASYTIPQNTPFMLTATANDPDGDDLTYSWEQFDLGNPGPPNTDDGTRPIFRSGAPTSNPWRLFPDLSNILSNSPSLGQSLPVTTRTMNFRVTVRDNRSGGGAVNSDAMQVNVRADAGPFTVNAPASAWPVKTVQTVTWNVANTNNAPVSCDTVRITLDRTPGAISFPIVLANNTPNDGSETVTIPGAPTIFARIKVEAVGNVFFNISPEFQITGAEDLVPTISGFSPGTGTAGTAVTINGTNFITPSGVRFNGVAASFTVNSTTQIVATVPAGASSGPITVTTANGTATSASSFTVPVSASTVQLSSSGYIVSEAAGSLDVVVNRSGDTSGPATVNYATSDAAGLTNCQIANGIAAERCDYGTTVGTLRFAAGETSKSFTIPIVSDVLVEGDETFTVTLSGPTGTTLSSSQTATVTIDEDDATPATQNPIDNIPFFVTQQYIDFLGRLPDTIGFQNWVNTLQSCPNGGFGENDNPHCDRVHVSAGFFLSPEFQGRGYFAYRFYEVALDRRPTYAEFVPDMAIVGGPQSPESEVLSKAAYTAAWTDRPEFRSRYDSLSNFAYVNALEANAEVTVFNKPTLFAALEGGTMNRGQVLRNIVESSAVRNRFFNRAFVSMQYFGYLRRDPDSIGFQNWVNTLNADPSNFRHMIFGFLFSTEYRQRFGP